MKNRKFVAVASAGAIGASLMLTGCSEAQQAIDQAQGLVETAQVLSQACEEAAVAWSPGASVAEATEGLSSAASAVDQALASDPSLPGAANLLAELESALVQVEGAKDGAAITASTAAVQLACNAFGGQ